MYGLDAAMCMPLRENAPKSAVMDVPPHPHCTSRAGFQPLTRIRYFTSLQNGPQSTRSLYLTVPVQSLLVSGKFVCILAPLRVIDLILTTHRNGDWNEVTDCQIDLLEDVLQTCDDSMSLLLGGTTSLGTLHEINRALKDNELGPEKAMPGSCCLDDP